MPHLAWPRADAPARRDWRPHEDRPWYSLAPLRAAVLPPSVAKRLFVFPRVNIVGVAVPELLVAAAILALTVFLAATQRTAEVAESGDFAQIFFIALFLFIMYRSLISYVFGISFERSMFWHGYIAALAAAYSIWHGLCAIYWGEIEDKDGEKAVQGWHAFTTGPYRFEFITGLLATTFLVTTVIVSVRPIRKAARRAWLISHHILPLLAVVFSVIHGAPSVLVGVAIYVLDRLFGYVYLALFRYKNMGKQCRARVLKSGLVMLSFPREYSFVPGQFMGVQVPNVSVLEYHTFSIASIPSDKNMVMLIKPDGYWTTKLEKVVKDAQSSEGRAVEMPARIHGPVGSIGLDWQSGRYKMFLLIAGGVGITPLVSVYRHLLDQKLRGRPVEIVRLVWSARSRQIAEDVATALLEAMAKTGNASELEAGHAQEAGGFTTDVFITGDSKAKAKSRKSETEGQKTVSRALGRVVWREQRPQLERVFEKARDEAKSVDARRVAVLACGPEQMTTDVCNVAAKAGSRAVRFDVHLEHFT